MCEYRTWEDFSAGTDVAYARGSRAATETIEETGSIRQMCYKAWTDEDRA